METAKTLLDWASASCCGSDKLEFWHFLMYVVEGWVKGLLYLLPALPSLAPRSLAGEQDWQQSFIWVGKPLSDSSKKCRIEKRVNKHASLFISIRAAPKNTSHFFAHMEYLSTPFWNRRRKFGFLPQPGHLGSSVCYRTKSNLPGKAAFSAYFLEDLLPPSKIELKDTNGKERAYG